MRDIIVFLQNMGKILALDFGTKRTGIAITDDLQLIASGLTTVATNNLLQFLHDYCEKHDVDCFVIGLPKQMDNTSSESEDAIQRFISKLKLKFPKKEIVRQDETIYI